MSSIANLPPSSFPQQLPERSLAPSSSSLKEKVCRTALIIFRYTTFAAIALGSAFFLGQNFAGRCQLFILAGCLSFTAGNFIIHSTKDIANGEISKDQLSAKAAKISRVALWTVVSLGALFVGFSGGYLLSGASFLMQGVSSGGALPILSGLVDLTFTLGFTFPLVKGLFKHSAFLYKQYDPVKEKLQKFLETLQPEEGAPRRSSLESAIFIFGGLALLLAEALGFDSSRQNESNPHFDNLLQVAEFLPDEALHEQFRAHLPRITDERLSEVITSFPNVFTIEFLANTLPEERFRKVVAPKIICPLTREQLEEMQTDLEAQKQQLIHLQQREKKGESHETLRVEAEQIATILTARTNQIHLLKDYLRKLSNTPLPEKYKDLQDKINESKKLETQEKEISCILFDSKPTSLRNQLLLFQSLVSLEKEDDDKEDPSYEVLGEYGFTIRDFDHLNSSLGVDEKGIEASFKYLTERGLETREDLVKQKILDRPETGNLTKEIIAARIVTFCTQPQEVLVEKASSKQASSSSEAVSRPRWVKLTRIINNLFHVVLSTTLTTLQIFYQPISTLMGFAFRLQNRNFLPPGLNRLYQPAPDYIHQGFSERMRNLYGRISTVTWSISLGPPGGFFAGIDHANALLHYGGNLRNRILGRAS